MENRQARKISSDDGMERSEASGLNLHFRVFRYRELEESRVETLHHRSPEVAKCKTSKSRNRHIKPRLNLHFRVLDTGSWRRQESRLFIIGVPKLRNAKRQNPKTGTSNHDLISISKFQIPGVGGVKSRDSSSQESRSCEMQNTEILKQAHQQRLHFGVLQTGKSKIKGTLTFEVANPEILKQTRRRPVKF
jgi:hypothetical protein